MRKTSPKSILTGLVVALAWAPGMLFAAEYLPLVVCNNPQGTDCPVTTQMFPSVSALNLPGSTYTDTIPDTLDLQTWAKEYYHGAISSMLSSQTYATALANGQSDIAIPDPNTYVYPIQVIYRKPDSARQIAGGDPEDYCWRLPAPCFSTRHASQWPVALSSIIRAREMAGNAMSAEDRQKELLSLRGVFAYDQSMSAAPYNPGELTQPHHYSVLLLNDLVRQFPDNAVYRDVLREYERFMQARLVSRDGFQVWDNRIFPNQSEGNGGYYNDNMVRVSVQGYTGEAFGDSYLATGNSQALALSGIASNYVRNYGNGLFWQNPDPSRFSADGPVIFVGHTPSFVPALNAILLDVRARLKADPSQAASLRGQVEFVKSGFEFMKRRGNATALGNFGVAFTIGEMLQLAASLESIRTVYPDIIPYSQYYEEAERWIRNQAAEQRITPEVASHIGNGASGDERFNRVRDRVKGTFLSDASHIFNQPYHDLQDNNDGLWLMRGLYDIWKQAVEVNITNGAKAAWVNLLLNNATQYMDVYSDLPYRGRVVVDMRNDSGGITQLAVRIPSWAGQNVTIYENAGNGDVQLVRGVRWDWTDRYASINQVKPGAVYTVRFPMVVRHLPVTQLTGQDEWWYEANYGSLNNPEQPRTVTGTFIGDTLVDLERLTGAPIQRYQRPDLLALVSGNTVNEVAPPQRTVTRFALAAPAHSQPETKVTLTANGQSNISISLGEEYALSYSSENATSCTLSWQGTGPHASEHGSAPVPPNTSGSSPSGLIGTYTMSCVGTAGMASASVTIAQTIAAPTANLTVNGQTSLVYPGENYTLAWSSGNVSSCTMSYVSNTETGSFPVTPNTSGSGRSGLIGSYTLTCMGQNGQNVTRSVTITLPANIAVPVVSFTVNGESSVTLAPGENFTVAWNSSGAARCTIERAADGSVPTESSVPPNVAGSSQGAAESRGLVYRFICWGANGLHSAKTVYVRSQSAPGTGSPSVTLNVNGQDSIVYPGANYSLSYSSANVTSCTMSYSGQESGSFPVTPNEAGSSLSGLIGSYTLSCTNDAGQRATKTVSISSAGSPPVVSLTVDGVQNATVQQGAVYTVAYSSSNADSCEMTNAQGGVGPIPPNTSGTSLGGAPAPGQTFSYKFSCTNQYGVSVMNASAMGQ